MSDETPMTFVLCGLCGAAGEHRCSALGGALREPVTFKAELRATAEVEGREAAKLAIEHVAWSLTMLALGDGEGAEAHRDAASAWADVAAKYGEIAKRP